MAAYVDGHQNSRPSGRRNACQDSRPDVCCLVAGMKSRFAKMDHIVIIIIAIITII